MCKSTFLVFRSHCNVLAVLLSSYVSAIICVMILCSHTLHPQRTSTGNRCACEFIMGMQSERR